MRKHITKTFTKLFFAGGLLAVMGQAACVAETSPDGDTESASEQGEALSYAQVGFAWVNGTGTPSASYSYNSSGGSISVSSSATGAYEVTFNGLSGAGGNVQVVAYGSTNSRCKVQNWYSSGTAQKVNVRCHAASGSAVNSAFVVRYARPDGGYDGTGAYVWASSPNATLNTAYNANSTYSWNSSGGTNQITRTGTGSYRVSLPGMSNTGGSVEVTAYGGGAEHCKVQNWQRVGTETRVNVLCFDASGAAANTYFNLNYLAPGQVAAYDYGAYLWANNSTSSSYTPSSSYSYNSGDINGWTGCSGWIGDNTAGNYSTGYYFARHTFLSATNAVPHVTAYGSDSSYCKVQNWMNFGDGTEVKLRCFDGSGNLVNTQFVETYNSSWVRGPC